MRSLLLYSGASRVFISFQCTDKTKLKLDKEVGGVDFSEFADCVLQNIIVSPSLFCCLVVIVVLVWADFYVSPSRLLLMAGFLLKVALDGWTSM